MGILHATDEPGVYDVGAGCYIGEAISEGRKLAAFEPVTFRFNGVRVTVAQDSVPTLIERDFHRAIEECISKAVGPYPTAELSLEDVLHGAEVRAENARKAEERAAKYAAEIAAAASALNAKLAPLPAIELKDPDGWRKSVEANTDGYGAAVMRFADGWARLMQGAMAEGKPLEEVADPLSYEVSHVEGITGFQFGCAVSILSQVWKHGEALRRWHNLKSQIGTEGERANADGGVLNPALLNIG